MEQDLYQVTHVLPEPDKIRLKVERNSKGHNWEATVTAMTLQDALDTLDMVLVELRTRFPQE